MSSPCGCPDPEVLGCQCIEEATSTITPSGAGSVGDPRVHDVNLDPDTRNAIEDTGTGLLVLHDLDAARIRNDADQAITADDNYKTVEMATVMYDFGGLYNGADGFTVVRAGVYLTILHVQIGGGTGCTKMAAVIEKNGVVGAAEENETGSDTCAFSIPFMTSGPVGAVFKYKIRVNTGSGYSIQKHNNWSAYATIAQLNNLSDGQPDF
jgi:hypothetical protein